MSLKASAYPLLFILAVIANKDCKKGLLLTLMVGLSGLMPMQMVTNYYAWWTICLGFELFKLTVSVFFKIRMSYPLVLINGLLLSAHLSLLVTTNWVPHTIIVPALEYIEIISCLLFSKPLLLKLKGIRWIQYRWQFG